MDLVLHTDASYRNDLDTGKFARMLDDPSQCYKFYWLEAILNLMPTEEGDISFEKTGIRCRETAGLRTVEIYRLCGYPIREMWKSMSL